MNRQMLATSTMLIALITTGHMIGLTAERNQSRSKQSSLRSFSMVGDAVQASIKPPQVAGNLQDMMSDYMLFSALPVTGNEWVVDVIFPGEEEWTLLGNPVYSPGTEKSYYSGVRSFSSEYAATRDAEYLYEAGLIDGYYVFERPKQPVWLYVDTFDTLAEAQAAAAIIEATSDRITRIDAIMVDSITLQLP